MIRSLASLPEERKESNDESLAVYVRYAHSRMIRLNHLLSNSY